MADFQAVRDGNECVQRCNKKLTAFVFKEDEETNASLHLLLDELIALDCNSLGMKSELINSVLTKLCGIIPVKYERLVTKVCHVIHNFIRYKLPLFPDTCKIVTNFLMMAVAACPKWAMADILRAVAAMMEDHWEPFLQHQDLLTGKSGVLIRSTEVSTIDVGTLAEAVHCLRCLTVRTRDKEGLSSANSKLCFTTLLRLLHVIPSLEISHNLQCRIVVDTLIGVQSLLDSTKIDIEPHLGQLLAAVKGYMFHGLGQPVTIPPQLFPTITSGYNVKSPKSTASAVNKSPKSDLPTSTSTKLRSKKTRKKKSDADEETMPRQNVVSVENSEGNGLTEAGFNSLCLQPSWTRFTSSDSELSDSEASQGVKTHTHSTRVRVTALSCLAVVCKLVDKRSMFGYWPFFIPDSAAAGNSPQVQTLFTSILKDPSPKCRMGALVSLTAMLDGTKQFLAAAEESSPLQTAFTPLSNVLGAMIRELHRALLQALVVENYNLTLTQLIKCLSTLVVNVPYHRLQPGLLFRVVKQIRHFLVHKDSNVRVACLTCLDALVSHQPPLMEVFHILQSPQPPVGMITASTPRGLSSALNDSGMGTQSPGSLASSSTDPASSNTDSASNNTDPASSRDPVQVSSRGSSGRITPTVGTSSGIQTPIFSDQLLQAQVHTTSWLIKLCIRNILPQARGSTGDNALLEPLPVRLKSLQVLATVTRGYFPIIRGELGLMQDLIQRCLEDADSTVRLHGCKVLEELGAMMVKDIQASQEPQTLSLQQVRSLWESVLDGPLLKMLKQPETNNPVRASACDCVANIGAEVFPLLSQDQQKECLWLVLHLTQCSDRLVVSEAVRALGVLVLYPCHSQDVTFLADAANAILKCMSVPSINVKIKAAWALGNFCDALVVNKDRGDKQFVDQFSDMLLTTLLTTATKATQESDKVKCNAVRAVGNVLRYLPARSLGKSHLLEAVTHGVSVLIKAMTSGPMKVRWNSCYAIANMLRNPLLLTGDTPWLMSVLTALSQVAKDCNNFKVRINAALALAVPSERRHYGDVALFAVVWKNLVESLKTAEDITDFAEYRYRDSLAEQVCLAVLHMLSLSEAADVVALLPTLQTAGPTLHEHMHRFLLENSIIKVSAVKKVKQRLSVLAAESGATEDLSTGLRLLFDLCLPGTEGEAMDLSPPRPIAFRQIYD